MIRELLEGEGRLGLVMPVEIPSRMVATGVSARAFPPLSKQGRIEEDRVKKMANVKNISTRYSGRRGKKDRPRQVGRDAHLIRQDDTSISTRTGSQSTAPSKRTAEEDQHDRQYEAGDEKIDELGEDWPKGRSLSGKRTLVTSFGNRDQRVGPDPDRGDEEGPGNRPDGAYVHEPSI